MTDTEYTNGIPPISDYAHWNEDAERVWYEENRYDMEHPEVFDEDPYDDFDRYYPEELSFDKCIELGIHGQDTSCFASLFGPNADVIAWVDDICSNCEEPLASEWEPKGYRVHDDKMIIYREEFTRAGRKHYMTDTARFAVYEKVQ